MQSPIEQSCKNCGLGRRVDGTIVPPILVPCPGHDFQIQPQQAGNY